MTAPQLSRAAYERLRRLTRRLEAAKEDERQHIARELHDSVTQTIYSASLIAETVPIVWTENPEEGQRGLDQLQRRSTQASL